MNIICIPTYNEKENIAKMVFCIRQYDLEIKIMVIDDNSPDGTGKIVKDLMKKDSNLSILERRKKEGLGTAYIEAFNKIISAPELENIVIMDADGSHDPKHIPEMLSKAKDFDMVIGSRYVDGGGVSGWQWHRKLLSQFANLYCHFLLRVPIHDLTAGFVCFRKSVLINVDYNRFHSLGYSFQVEFKCFAYKAGCSFVEIPIAFEDRERGDSKMSLPVILESMLIPFRLLFQNKRL